MEGVFRRVTMTKGSLLGEIGRYHADDYVVWRHEGEADRQVVFRERRGAPEVVLQRFVFVERRIEGARLRRSFWLGFRGFLEIYPHAVHERGDKAIADLAGLIDRAWDQTQGRGTHAPGTEQEV